MADEVFTGKIDSISEYIEPQSKSFEVVCKLTSGSEILRPGMFVNVSFVIDSKKNIYKLPLRALVGTDRLWYVDRSESRAKKLNFKPIFFDDDFFVVSDGYKDLDFIIEGNSFIYDSQPVSVIDDDLEKDGENIDKEILDESKVTDKKRQR